MYERVELRWANGLRGDHEREEVCEDEGAQCDNEGAIDGDGDTTQWSSDPAVSQDSKEFHGAW